MERFWNQRFLSRARAASDANIVDLVCSCSSSQRAACWVSVSSHGAADRLCAVLGCGARVKIYRSDDCQIKGARHCGSLRSQATTEIIRLRGDTQQRYRQHNKRQQQKRVCSFCALFRRAGFPLVRLRSSWRSASADGYVDNLHTAQPSAAVKLANKPALPKPAQLREGRPECPH